MANINLEYMKGSLDNNQYGQLSAYYKAMGVPLSSQISRIPGYSKADAKFFKNSPFNIMVNETSHVGDPRTFTTDYSTNYGYPSDRSNAELKKSMMEYQVMLQVPYALNSYSPNYYTFANEYKNPG